LLTRLAHVSKDAVAYGIAGALSRFSALILLPLYTNLFTKEEYGIFQSVTNLGALLLAITVLGLDGASSILYFATEDGRVKRLICTIWAVVSLVVSIPVTLVLIFGAEWLSWVATGTPQYATLFRLGVAVLPFSLFLLTTNNILRLLFRARAYALLNLGLTVLVVALIVYLVGVARWGLEGALWGALIGNAIVAVPSALVLKGTVSLSLLKSGVWPMTRRMLQLGLPLVPAGIALWITNFSNTYFLLQLVGAGAAGVFRIGAQLASVLSLAIWAFQLAWAPYSLSIAREPDAPRTFSRIATLFTAGVVGVSVLMSALAPAILAVLTNKDYAQASSVIGLLSLAAAASGAYYVVSIGINLAQRTGLVAWTTIAAALSNVVLNLALIPLWGLVGAGIASLAANLLSTVLVYMMAQRVYNLPYESMRVLIIWLVGGACVAGAGVFNAVIAPPVWLSALAACALLLFFAATLLVARIITPSEITALIAAIRRRAGRAPHGEV
jgi:O-antigen/teichoic acid export membrane protein